MPDLSHESLLALRADLLERGVVYVEGVALQRVRAFLTEQQVEHSAEFAFDVGRQSGGLYRIARPGQEV